MDQQNKKLDKIQDDVGEIKVHMAKYNTLLEIHIKRTEILEQKLEPVEKHVAQVNLLGRIALFLISSGIIGFIIRLAYGVLHK